MQKRKYRHHSESFKMEVLQEYYLGASSFISMCRKHELPPSVLREWIRRYPVNSNDLSLSSEQQQRYMSKHPRPTAAVTEEEILQQRVASLENALHYANLRIEGLNVLIDIAEKNEGIQIRKKPGAKQ